MAGGNPDWGIAFDARVQVLELRETEAGQEVVSTDEGLASQLLSLYPAARLRLLPDLALGAKTSGLVQVSVAPLRGEHRQASEQISQLMMGHPVDVLEKANADWYRVRGPEGYLGFLHREHLQPAQPCWNTGYLGLPKRVVAASYCTAWADPYDHTEAAFDLSAGCIVAVGDVWVGESGAKGLTVYSPDMRRGYLSEADLLPPEQAAFQPAGMLPWARRWMGVPYLWGGVSPRGIDCSGLVQLSAWMCGQRLPRDASQQALIGEEVPGRDWQDLLPGDLLFMGDKQGRITHVAIYEGEAKYIHASGRVRRNSLRPEDADFEPHRFTTWQWTRRIG